jgi:hypothetical protein
MNNAGLKKIFNHIFHLKLCIMLLAESITNSGNYLIDDPKPSIEKAHEYFSGLKGPEFKAGPFDPNIQDQDGLVSYLVASTNPPPTEIQKLYDEIAPVMEGLTNVVVSAILKIAGDDESKKHDPSVWRDPFQAMAKAFCGGFSQESKSYQQQVRGVEVASKMINIITDAVVNTGSAVFKGFVDFLTSQGEVIKAEISGTNNDYLYAAVTIVHEIFEASDGRFIYVPKFKSYFTKFNQETLKISTSCGSYNQYKFNFDLQIMTGAFMVNTWQSDKDFQTQVKDFIKKFQEANIQDSTNYFEGVFNSNQSSLV